MKGRGGAWQPRVVAGDDVSIAARDWSGTGPDLVLLHGAGPDQSSMARLAAALTASFRVVTYDMRGCGGSSAGPWSFATALEDLHAVIDGLGLANPLVVGHSLGGMVAVAYAGQHPDAPAVVNIDGWGPGRPEQYAGEDPDAVRALHERFARLEPHTMVGRLVDPLIKRSPTARRHGAMLRQSIAAVCATDVLALHRSASCPVLALVCTAPARGPLRLLVGAEASRLLQSYRRGRRTDLDRLVEEHPNVTVRELDAPHHVTSTDPQLVADVITLYVAGLA